MCLQKASKKWIREELMTSKPVIKYMLKAYAARFKWGSRMLRVCIYQAFM